MVAFFTTAAVSLLAVVPAISASHIAARQGAGLPTGLIPGLDKIDAAKANACFTGACTTMLTAFTSNAQCMAAATAAGASTDPAAAQKVFTDCLCTDAIVTALPSCMKCLGDAGAVTQTDIDQSLKEYTTSCKSAGKDVNLTGGAPAASSGTGTNTAPSTQNTAKTTNTNTTSTTGNTSGASAQYGFTLTGAMAAVGGAVLLAQGL